MHLLNNGWFRCWGPDCRLGGKDGFDVWLATHEPSKQRFVVLATNGDEGLKEVIRLHLKMEFSLSPFGQLLRSLGDSIDFETFGFELVDHGHGGSNVQEGYRAKYEERPVRSLK